MLISLIYIYVAMVEINTTSPHLHHYVMCTSCHISCSYRAAIKIHELERQGQGQGFTIDVKYEVRELMLMLTS